MTETDQTRYLYSIANTKEEKSLGDIPADILALGQDVICKVAKQ